MRLSVSLSGVLLFNNLCYAFCLRLMGLCPNPRQPPLKKGAGHPKSLQYFRAHSYGQEQTETQWGWQ